jgi:hypothetical protein
MRGIRIAFSTAQKSVVTIAGNTLLTVTPLSYIARKMRFAFATPFGLAAMCNVGHIAGNTTITTTQSSGSSPRLLKLPYARMRRNKNGSKKER